MTALAKIGGNNPPDPVEVLFEKHGAIIAEAENWLDGAEVQSEEQMAAVDVLITWCQGAGKRCQIRKGQ